jgi:hypothetical protein
MSSSPSIQATTIHARTKIDALHNKASLLLFRLTPRIVAAPPPHRLKFQKHLKFWRRFESKSRSSGNRPLYRVFRQPRARLPCEAWVVGYARRGFSSGSRGGQNVPHVCRLGMPETTGRAAAQATALMGIAGDGRPARAAVMRLAT